MAQTQTFQQIQKQIEALQQRAAERRLVELASVIQQTKETIAVWELRPQDLFDGLQMGKLGKAGKAGKTGKTAKQTRSASAGLARSGGTKYADGKGGTWGGLGKRPRWLQEALAAGAQLADFLVEQPGTAPDKKTVSSSPAQDAGSKRVSRRVAAPTRGARRVKAAPKPRYSDGTGNTWSGRGPKPKWVKSALAEGKQLSDLAS